MYGLYAPRDPKNHAFAEFMDGITIAAVSDERRGGIAVQVSWTVRF
ncbi:MAG: hypothetical protein LBB48_02750 [Treponema sp.]|nr:hypothetical protein [Treponema sp.]